MCFAGRGATAQGTIVLWLEQGTGSSIYPLWESHSISRASFCTLKKILSLSTLMLIFPVNSSSFKSSRSFYVKKFWICILCQTLLPCCASSTGHRIEKSLCRVHRNRQTFFSFYHGVWFLTNYFRRKSDSSKGSFWTYSPSLPARVFSPFLVLLLVFVCFMHLLTYRNTRCLSACFSHINLVHSTSGSFPLVFLLHGAFSFSSPTKTPLYRDQKEGIHW